MHRHRLFREERVHVGRVRVGHQLHVGLVDGLPAGDRRTVEHEALIQEILVDLVRQNRHVLQLAARIGKADVDVFDVLVLDRLQDVFLAHGVTLLSLSVEIVD